MDFKGKKIAFLGDSITEGVGPSCLENVYWKILERNTGALCYGYGISGSRIANQRIHGPYPESERYFATRVDSMIPDADIIVVFGGVNDFGHGDAPFGCHTDRTDDTFCGAVHLLMERLINRYPDGTIVFMTPLHCVDEDDVTYTCYGARRCGNLQRYVDAIMEAAAYYAIPVLDLYRISGIQPRVEGLRQKYMPDGLHPNDAGNAKIASRLEGFLRTL